MVGDTRRERFDQVDMVRLRDLTDALDQLLVADHRVDIVGHAILGGHQLDIDANPLRRQALLRMDADAAEQNQPLDARAPLAGEGGGTVLGGLVEIAGEYRVSRHSCRSVPFPG